MRDELLRQLVAEAEILVGETPLKFRDDRQSRAFFTIAALVFQIKRLDGEVG